MRFSTCVVVVRVLVVVVAVCFYFHYDCFINLWTLFESILYETNPEHSETFAAEHKEYNFYIRHLLFCRNDKW